MAPFRRCTKSRQCPAADADDERHRLRRGPRGGDRGRPRARAAHRPHRRPSPRAPPDRCTADRRAGRPLRPRRPVQHRCRRSRRGRERCLAPLVPAWWPRRPRASPGRGRCTPTCRFASRSPEPPTSSRRRPRMVPPGTGSRPVPVSRARPSRGSSRRSAGARASCSRGAALPRPPPRHCSPSPTPSTGRCSPSRGRSRAPPAPG